MILPKDLQTYCRKRILKRVVPCIILVSLFATILIIWGDVIFNTDNKSFQNSCYIITMLLPFVITGVPYKLLDSTYYGTIRKINIVATIDNDSSVKPTREHLYWRNTVYLSVERPDGKLLYRKAHSVKAEEMQNVNTYKEGDSVFHLYGTNIVVVLPDSNNGTIQCSVCGSSNNIENDKCRDCGHSLVKRI